VTPSFELLDAHDTRGAAPDPWDEDIDKRRRAAEAITPLTAWSAIRDEALKTPCYATRAAI
jgi:hypothetical protein